VSRRSASSAGLSERTHYEVAPAASFPGTGYDLIAMFDCLHDMGDPVGAARHVRKALAPAGTWMVVEPLAGDSVEENLNPVGRVFYGASTVVCTPASLAQEVGLALGARDEMDREGDRSVAVAVRRQPRKVGGYGPRGW